MTTTRISTGYKRATSYRADVALRNAGTGLLSKVGGALPVPAVVTLLKPQRGAEETCLGLSPYGEEALSRSEPCSICEPNAIPLLYVLLPCTQRPCEDKRLPFRCTVQG